MYIKLLISILSCNDNCIRIFNIMMNKKIIFGLFLISLLGACGGPTAMLGPAYTFTSTGSLVQAGLSYGSNEVITNYTGKTPIENLEDLASHNISNKKNIYKKTLESADFFQLVKNKIEMSKGKIKVSNQ